MKMVCVEVVNVFTSAAESTLLYMRKSLIPPLKGGSTTQLLFPSKLVDLSIALGYEAGLTNFTWTPLMYNIQVPEPAELRVHTTWFQVFPLLKGNNVEAPLPVLSWPFKYT